VFQHIYTHGTSDITVRELYREIMPTFESTILTTHKSKFVQYCIFLLCGLEAKAIDDGGNGLDSQTHAILHRDFAAKLIEIVVDPYRATMTRQSGACYLASFISRATYVSPETVCESIAALLRWAEAYIYSLKINGVRAADAREQSELHSLFYTICQSAFYIMCFRGVEAVQFYRSAVDYHSSSAPTGEAEWDLPHPDHVDIGCKRWTVICGHELQPLRFCLESVRSEFLHVAHTFEMIDSHTLEQLVVEAKRLSTGRVSKKAASRIYTAATMEKKRQTGGVGGLGRGSNPLNSFFPFDPFLLRRSHDFIEPFYNYWQGPIQEDDMVEDDDEDDAAVDFTQDADDSDAEDDNSVDSSTQVQPMSYASNYTSCSDNPLLSTSETNKESLKHAWIDATKRPRSLSIENGSW
jgi:RNA polymerase I-specific transcription initiation factor RRN3